ncbi:MAG: D-alanyl-D-alanine carboxypeptidase/D-alanyl-D-alanine endopeptidase [Gammaproteobacteria bacterium]
MPLLLRLALLPIVALFCFYPAVAPVGAAEDVLALMHKYRVKPENVGVWIQRAGDDAPMVAHNGDLPLNPASVIKLITGWAAINKHGGRHLFRTGFRYTGAIQKGELNGDLYFVGGGDPHITVDNFLHLLNQLRDLGVQKINGDLIIDGGYFDVPPHDPFVFDGAGRQPYNAGAFAAGVNFQSQKVVVASGGKGVRVYTSPPNDNFVVRTALKTARRKCRWPGAAREHYSGDGKSDSALTLTLKGAFGRRCKVQFTVHPQNPAAHAAGVWSALWRRLGGEWNGKWRRGKTPPQTKPLAAMWSLRVPQLVYAMNKHSNNLIARHLFLSVGEGPPFDLPSARAEMMRQLSAAGVDTRGWNIDNGSGLSRKTRITARGMGGVLADVWQNPMRAEVIASLPILGVDGALRRRLAQKPYRRNGHLKTGGLKNVRALAGFLRGANGGELFFVSIVNQRGGAVRDFEHALIKWAHSRG